MRNLKLTVAYDGTAYFGFQNQADPAFPTVQAALIAAWKQLSGDDVHMNGAGRTDAGVHADGQVVNFHTARNHIPAQRVPLAMNSVLPDDIKVIECEQVPLSFHAQYDAVSKQYTYRFLNTAFPLPKHRWYTHFVHRPLDVDAMHEGAQMLVGHHDFRALTRAKQIRGSTVRHIMRCDVVQDGPVVAIVVEADGFLFHMIRTIAGTLLQIGTGSRPPVFMREVLAGRDRAKAGKTLPGKGLTLDFVRY